MTKLIKVRFIEPDDMDLILKIEAQNHKFDILGEKVNDPRQLNKKNILSFIEEDRTRLVVIEADKIVEGFLMFDARDINVAVITRLSVNTKNISLGSLLLDEAIKFAKKAYVNKIKAYVYEYDNDAIAFFSKKGFKGKLIRNRTQKMVDGNLKKFDEIEFTKKVDLNDSESTN